MRYWICLLFCFVASPIFSQESIEDLILSTADQVATLNSDNPFLIGGLVSPLSGHLCVRQTDLIAKGAQEITLSRSYIPPYMPVSFSQSGNRRYDMSPQASRDNEKHREAKDRNLLYEHLKANYQGWVFLPHLRLQVINQSPFTVRLIDPNGVTLDVRVSNDSKITLVEEPYGITNACGDNPGGHYDIRNTRIVCEQANTKIIVTSPEGTIRSYQKQGDFYLLDKEILPNGKLLRYSYAGTSPCLIESLDPQERYVYASIRIEGSPQTNNCLFTSNSGLMASYYSEHKIVLVYSVLKYTSKV